MLFSEDQKSAIYTKNKNILVSASAGAGKTTVLVERIIQSILNKENNINIDELLIVTFTNNAASEMKSRIYSALNQKINENNNNLNKYHLKEQLYRLNKCYISTIDSFCLKIVKKNFKILQIDPNFSIGDEAEIENLKQKTLNEFIENLYEEQNDDFLELIESYSPKIDDGNYINTFLSIYNKIQNIFDYKNWLKNSVEKLNIQDENTLLSSTFFQENFCEIKYSLNVAKNILDDIKKIFENFKNSLDKNFEIPSFFNTDFKICRELSNYLEENAYSKFINVASNLKFETFRLTNLKKLDPQAYEEIKTLRDEFKDILNSISKDYFPYSIEQTLNNNKKFYKIFRIFLKLIIEFDEKFLKLKKSEKIFTHTDIAHFCLEILLNKENKVAKEYQEKFKEIIIDEYQDINPIQDKILTSISNGKNMFMVGDMKQCIYKFRNSDPSIFREKLYNINDATEIINLNENFRSNENIINAINFVFEEIMTEELGEVSYKDNSKLKFKADFLDLDNNNINKTEKCELFLIDIKNIDIVKDEFIENLEKVELEANFIVKRIKKLVNEDKFKIFNKNTKKYELIKYKDIVILLRKKKDTVNIISKVLNENGIPTFSKASSGFFDFIEISTIVNILKIIDNPIQDLPLIAVLHSSIFCLKPEELIEIKMFSNEKIFYNSVLNYINSSSENINLNIQNKLKYFINKLKNWQELTQILSISELISFIYEDTNYYNYVGILSKGQARQANLTVFLEKSISFEKNNFNSLFNFLSYVEKMKNKNSEGEVNILAEDEDLVRIMTIHESKGLEFPVVFIPNLSINFNKMDLNETTLIHNDLGIATSIIYIPDEYKNSTLPIKFKFDTFQKRNLKLKIYNEALSEEIRVLYVALTRAKEKLILIGSQKDIKNLHQDKWENMLKNKTLLKKASSFLDWIAASLQKENPFWSVHIIDKSDITLNNNVNSKKSEEIFNFNFSKLLESAKNSSENSDYINEKLNWTYPNNIEKSLKSTSTITEIKRNYQREILGIENFSDFDLKFDYPKFYKTQLDKISAAQIGKIYHTVLEHIDFNISSLNELEIFINKLKKDNILENTELKIIDREKILNFLKSDLVKRIKNSNLVKREQHFTIGLLPEEVYSTSEYKGLKSKVLVNGIIDLYFEEKDKIILVDYKTDKTQNFLNLREKYSIQLEIYKKVLERNTGKKVKESIIYLVNSSKYFNI